MMGRSFASVVGAMLATAAVAQVETEQIWNQSVSVAVYTSAALTRQPGGLPPNFGLASWLNPPEVLEVFNTSAEVWSFAAGAGTYLVDMARHAESQGSAVDTFGAVLASSGGATLYGFSSAGTGTPVWTLPLPGCASDLGGGTYVGLESSDSGNTVAFFCIHTNGSATTARVYGVNGQTGASWFFDLGPGIKAGQGQVQVTGDGAWVLFVNEGGVPTPNTATAWIVNGATGALRGNITIPFFITAAISDSGNYVAVGDDPAVHVWQWSAAAGAYAPAYDLTPPAGPAGWIPWDLQMTTGADAAELVIAGCISGDVLSVQVTAWALVGGAQTTNWVSAKNSKLQENPTVRADGPYIGVSLWGDAGELPTVVLLKSGADAPLVSAVTPGSMFAVDLAVDSSTAQGDVVYLTAAGKHVPANEMGSGGDAFAWRVTVPT